MDGSNKLAAVATELMADGKDATKKCSQILDSITELLNDVDSSEFVSNVASYRESINTLKEMLGDIKAGLSEANEIQGDSSREGPTIQRNLIKVNKVLRSATYFLETALEILHKLETIGLREKEEEQVQELLIEVIDNTQEMKYNLLDMQDVLNNTSNPANKKQAPAPPVKAAAPAPPTQEAPAPPTKEAPAPPTEAAPVPPTKAAPAPPVTKAPAPPTKPSPPPPVNTAPVKVKPMDENANPSALKEWAWNDKDGDDEEPGCWEKFRNCFCPCFGGNRYSV